MNLIAEPEVVWAASMQDTPGSLANKLAALAEAGADLGFIVARRSPEKPGKTIAGHTRPVRVANGKIFVEVKNDAWRNELVYHKKELLEKLNKSLNEDVIRDIVLI